MRVLAFVLPASIVFSAEAACPPDMVGVVGGLCIDRCEYPGCGHRPMTHASGVPEPGRDLSVTTICAAQGKRPCSMSEWTSACWGTGAVDYPYGVADDSAHCNTQKHWMEVDYVKIAARDAPELRRVDQSHQGGSNPACLSAVGAYDMLGNVEEWVTCPAGFYGWCLAGGYWARPATCTSAVVTHSPMWHYYETGFRCCLSIPSGN